MYLEHFGLSEPPFSIAPDPQYLYMSKRHRDALAHLFFGIQSDGGFILLTGEVGTGKTTLCRCLLEQTPSDVETAFIINPKLTAIELLATICDEFGISYPEGASLKILTDRINNYLLNAHSEGKRAVLIIDEAQNLSVDVLEQIRLLTNLETNERKLLQIILLGQPELADVLSDQKMRQFNQRITARFHLEALPYLDARDYVIHRLGIAGGDKALFSRSALKRIYKLSGGIPRVINLICDRALLGAYASNKSHVTGSIVNKAAEEVLGVKHRTHFALAAVALFFLALVPVGYFTLNSPDEEPAVVTQEGAIPLQQEPAPQAALPEPEPVVPVFIYGHLDINDAFHDLFALWGTAFEDRQSPPCELAQSIGLSCYEDVHDLTEVLDLNRPVIIRIDNEYLTLSAVHADSITLIAGERQYEISREEFAQRWDGSARLFWRMPPAYVAPLRRSDTGAAVDWLAIQLSMIAGDNPPLDEKFSYNEALEEQVREFQSSVGLSPNGVVDEPTWIHINSVEAIGIPTLDG